VSSPLHCELPCPVDSSRNVGFLRYYTISNMPLFLLAAPMMSMMIISGIWAFKGVSHEWEHIKGNKEAQSPRESGELLVLRNLAVSQLLLAFVTLTSAHVQIITRISSASPVWLWYLSSLFSRGDIRWAGSFLVFMVMYAIIQGGLFASFMPPA
jgi:phosphatidylinositol glycan class V